MTTTKTAHDPGPWEICEIPYRHIRTKGSNLCVWADDYKPDANGNLMVAAPDLLAVCEQVVKYMDANGGALGLQIAMAAKLAIAKATGR